MFMYSNIIMLTIHTRKLFIIDYRELQFRLDVTRIRGFSQTCYCSGRDIRTTQRLVYGEPYDLGV